MFGGAIGIHFECDSVSSFVWWKCQRSFTANVVPWHTFVPVSSLHSVYCLHFIVVSRSDFFKSIAGGHITSTERERVCHPTKQSNYYSRKSSEKQMQFVRSHSIADVIVNSMTTMARSSIVTTRQFRHKIKLFRYFNERIECTKEISGIRFFLFFRG